MKNPSRSSNNNYNNKWKNKNKYLKNDYHHDDVINGNHDHNHNNTLYKNEYDIDKLNHHNVKINHDADDNNSANGGKSLDSDVFIECKIYIAS
jgi:hypothetical protein